MRRLIRAIIDWAYVEEEVVLTVEPEVLGEEPVYFCRARPNTVPGFPPEHVHQTPATEADMSRSREFGWMTGEKCIIPAVAFTLFDGSGINHPSSVTRQEEAVGFHG